MYQCSVICDVTKRWSPEQKLETFLRFLFACWDSKNPSRDTAMADFCLLMYRLHYVGRASVIGESYENCILRDFELHPLEFLSKRMGISYEQSIQEVIYRKADGLYR